MASKPDLIAFASREAMAARVADVLEATLAAGSSHDLPKELAVSSGSTPKLLYETLAGRDLSWSSVHLTLVDERWVGQDHPRSNEAFIRDAFSAADGVDIAGLFNGAPSPEAGVKDLTDKLHRRRRAFDAVVLGMGDDGHTASWFPHADGLEKALTSPDPVCSITATQSTVTGEEIDRMTLTLSAIESARLIILLLAGDTKRAAFEKTLENGPPEDMPVRAIMRARPDMWVCWAP